jgi:putative transposase
LVEPDNPALSVRRQCELLGLNRSSFYYAPVGESPLNLTLMRRIDEMYTESPFYGYRKIAVLLQQEGYAVNRKRVARLMKLMGIRAICPGPQTSRPAPNHKVHPYLLRGVAIKRPNQVWSVDITYIRMHAGFMYLVAIIDWYSRFVLAWRLSNTLDGAFCLDALDEALSNYDVPEFFNSDQGSQFTALAFTGRLEKAETRISMDGRGRAFDNIFVERLWRTVKYEDIYLKEYNTVFDLERGLAAYFDKYNFRRPHQNLDYQTPAKVYFANETQPQIVVVREALVCQTEFTPWREGRQPASGHTPLFINQDVLNLVLCLLGPPYFS